MLGLCCCRWAFFSGSKWGLLSLGVVLGFLIAVASPAADHWLWHAGLSTCSTHVQLLHGTWEFPRQGSNPCPCIGRRILNHWTTREAFRLSLAKKV